MWKRVKSFLAREKRRKQWRGKNPHNYTKLLSDTDMNSIEVGQFTYGEIHVEASNSGSRLRIGNFCSIGPNVVFMLNSEHRLDTISTYPFKVLCALTEKHESFSKGDIVVGDDVWIGYGATIMSGVKIGQGAVIGAGAVVTKEVPPYAIVGGVPASVIKYRFEKDVIDALLKIDFSKWTSDFVKNNIEDLYASVSHENINELISKFGEDTRDGRD